MPGKRLCEQLVAGQWTGHGFARKLTLVAAPAGFGKTTLIIQIKDEGGRRKDESPPFHFCWVALDEADNHPLRFLRYVVAALQSALTDVGHEAAALLENSAPSALEEAFSRARGPACGPDQRIRCRWLPDHLAAGRLSRHP